MDKENLPEIFSTFFDSSHTVFFSYAPEKDLKIEYMSQNIKQFGYSAEEFLSGNVCYQDMILRNDLNRLVSEIKKYNSGRVNRFRLSYRIKDPVKTTFWIESDIHVQRDSQGEIQRYIGTLRDIKKDQNSDQKLLFMSKVVEHTEDMVRITDNEGKIVFVNEATLQHSGYQRDELLGNTHKVFYSGEQDNAFYADMWKSLLSEKKFQSIFANRKKSGELYYEHETITSFYNEDEGIEYYAVIGKDVTNCIEKERELYHLATVDTLTNIYNRQRCELQLDIELERFKRYGDIFTLMMIDIDDFKRVNDSFGHDTGDVVLKEITRIISAHIRKSDLFARWGGEEFMIIAQGVSLEKSIKFSEKLRSTIYETWFEDAGNISVSIGITTPKPHDTKENLVKRVDNALYSAKYNGKNRFYVVE